MKSAVITATITWVADLRPECYNADDLVAEEKRLLDEEGGYLEESILSALTAGLAEVDVQVDEL